MIRSLLLSILIWQLSFSLDASETIVQGNIKGFEGEKIRIALIEDYITFQKRFLTEVEIANGQFKLSFELDNSRQLFIMVEDKQTTLFAEAGQVYNLMLSYDTEANSQRAFEKFLDLKFSFPKSGELNQLIKSFNKDYQDFFSKVYRKVVLNSASKEIEAFIEEQEGKSIYQEPEYLRNYVRYSLAYLKDFNQVKESELLQEYLIGKEVLVEHKEYMNFFRQLYKEDFEQLVITNEGTELMKAMMMEEDLDATLELIQKLKGFDKKELAELYLINGLFEVYHKKTVNQKSSLLLLDKLSESSQEPGISILAENVRSQLSLLGKDSKAPGFELENTEGENVKLADLIGKPIYLNFWANWSLISLREMKLMQKLAEEYGDQVQFLSINVDENQAIFRSVKEKNQYDWPFLYGGKDYLLRENYQVKTVPMYFLIDREGKLVQRYAPSPEYIESELKLLIN